MKRKVGISKTSPAYRTVEFVSSVDLRDVGTVEIIVRNDGRVIWVNCDEICRLRICNIKEIELVDQRKHHPQQIAGFKNVLGQGQENARKHRYSVVVECNTIDAHHLADLFMLHYAMRSCLHYDGISLAMCYLEAGSRADEFRLQIEAFTEGYFLGKDGSRPKFLHKE